jgi:hypothetical protein
MARDLQTCPGRLGTCRHRLKGKTVVLGPLALFVATLSAELAARALVHDPAAGPI